MKEGHISFKFKSENKLDTVKFHGESIFIKDLKVLIAEARKLGHINSELIIYDEISNQIFENEKKISTNSVVIVERRTPDVEPINLLLDDKMYFMSDMTEDRKSGKCPICNDNFKLTITTTCCDKQACKACYETQFRNSKGRCFFCNNFAKSNQFFYNKNPESGGYRHMNKPYQSYGNSHAHPPPIPADIADILNNAKYFIIKSGNLDNIDLARKFNKWATTLPNQRKLNESFAISPNVLLIFSVNKSSKFQGFARMESIISNDQTSPFWKDTENIKLGGSFKIRWLRYSDLSFNKIAHLRNRYNNNEPIKKSRDTQEIPLEIGREICSYFENIENPLNKGPEDEISYMNYDLPEETLKPITTYSNEIASAPKNNEEDYDDVDRFMQENNLGVGEHYNEIKDQILNQSKEDEFSNKSDLEENQFQRKKNESDKSQNQNVENGKNAFDDMEENLKKNLQPNTEEKFEGKTEDLKYDKNYFAKMPGQMGYYPRNGGVGGVSGGNSGATAYPSNYMNYYYNQMWNPYMNYYGNNPNMMRMSNYYYNYSMMGNQNLEVKNDIEEKEPTLDSDKKNHKKKRNSSSKEKDRKRNHDKTKISKSKKERTKTHSRTRSRSKSHGSSRRKK